MDIIYLHTWYYQKGEEGKENARLAVELINKNKENMPLQFDFSAAERTDKQRNYFLVAFDIKDCPSNGIKVLQSWLNEIGVAKSSNYTYFPSKGQDLKESLGERYILHEFEPAEPAESETAAQPESSEAETAENEEAEEKDLKEYEGKSIIERLEKSQARRQQKRKRRLIALAVIFSAVILAVGAIIFINWQTSIGAINAAQQKLLAMLSDEIDKDDKWSELIFDSIIITESYISSTEGETRNISLIVHVPVFDSSALPIMGDSKPSDFLGTVIESSTAYLAGMNKFDSFNVGAGATKAEDGSYNIVIDSSDYEAVVNKAKVNVSDTWKTLAANKDLASALSDILFPDPVVVDYNNKITKIDRSAFVSSYIEYVQQVASKISEEGGISVGGNQITELERIKEELLICLAPRLFAPYNSVLSFNQESGMLTLSFNSPDLINELDKCAEEALGGIVEKISFGKPSNEQLKEILNEKIAQSAINLRYFSKDTETLTVPVDLFSVAENGVSGSQEALEFVKTYIDAYDEALTAFFNDVEQLPDYSQKDEPATSILTGAASGVKISLVSNFGDGAHYVLFEKIKSDDITEKGTPVLGVYIRNGDSFTVNLPEGYYKVKIALGATWYGLDYLFGTDGTYCLNKQPIEIRGGGYTYKINLLDAEKTKAGSTLLSLNTFAK